MRGDNLVCLQADGRQGHETVLIQGNKNKLSISEAGGNFEFVGEEVKPSQCFSLCAVPGNNVSQKTVEHL